MLNNAKDKRLFMTVLPGFNATRKLLFKYLALSPEGSDFCQLIQAFRGFVPATPAHGSLVDVAQ
ncbi:hypothetical protein EMIT0P294_240032 [Pseudomonas sp. IT-P294]